MKEMETDETDNSQLEADETGDYSCQVCGKVLSSLHNLYRHLETVHSVKGHVLCHICGKVFKRRDHLATHLKVCKLINCRECKEMHPESKMKKFKCQSCLKSFCKKENQKTHRKTCDPKSSDTLYCFCGKVFPDEITLKMHKDRHHRETKKCSICQKLFKDTLL